MIVCEVRMSCVCECDCKWVWQPYPIYFVCFFYIIYIKTNKTTSSDDCHNVSVGYKKKKFHKRILIVWRTAAYWWCAVGTHRITTRRKHIWLLRCVVCFFFVLMRASNVERINRMSTISTLHAGIYCCSSSVSADSSLIFEKSKSSPVPRLKMSSTSRQVVSKCVVASYDSEMKICDSSPLSVGSK